jgi:Collagen triple helix repeat (20 copies)
MSRQAPTASLPSRDILAEAHVSDAFAEALGRVVAEKQKEFETVIALREAQFKVMEAELRNSFSEQLILMKELVDQACARVKDGKDGVDGKDASEERIKEIAHGAIVSGKECGLLADWDDVTVELKRFIEEKISALPTPKDGVDGKNGIDGKNGKDVDMDVVTDVIHNAVATLVKFEFEAWPKPQDGKDGPQGEIGPQGPQGERGVPGERGETGEAGLIGLTGLQGIPGDNGRDGRDGLPGVPGAQGEKGIDGKNGIDGKDGAGFDDWSVQHDGKRTITITCGSGERTKSRVIVLPFPMFQGKWTNGLKYDQGDEVSHGGNTYRALCDTGEKPGQSEHWIIATNRGRDGRDGKNGEQGPQGPQGPKGMDLTQLGPDGKKW